MSYGCSNPVYGRTKNPHRLDRTPGGSSGGEVRSISKTLKKERGLETFIKKERGGEKPATFHQLPRELFWLPVDPSLVLEAILGAVSESQLT